MIDSSSGWGEWPDQIRAALLEVSRAEAVVDMLRQRALAELLAGFACRSIPVLVTKGGALAGTHYTHSHLRPRCDTDLFIHLQDIERVRQLFAVLGYEISPPIYKSHQFVCARSFSGAFTQFDIHWRILNAPQFARTISFEEAWERSVPLPGIAGGRALDAVDALLLACLHRKGSELHDENRLIWLCDIHLLASSLSAEFWTEFASRAVEKRMAGPCLDGLLRARTCLLTEIPAEIVRVLVQSNVPMGKFASSNLALLIDDLRCLPGLRAKSDLLQELFFTSPSSLMERYGKSNRAWLPLLYARQLFGGAAKRVSLQ